METILLKMNDLNVREEQYGKLIHASFFVKGGHIVALLGLDCSGSEIVFKLLLGKLQMNWRKEQIYYCEQLISEYNQIAGLIYHYKESNEALENWTVAEYVFSDRPTLFLLKSTLKKMKDDLEPILRKYGVNIDPMRKMGSVSGLERRKVEMIRANIRGAKIILLEDECEGLTTDEIYDYAVFLHKAIDEKQCIILMSHKESVFKTLADDMIIFRKGRVVKKAFNLEGHIDFDWKRCLLGNTLIKKNSMADSYLRRADDEGNIIYKVFDIDLCGINVNLDFRKGEITTFVILDNKKREDFFLRLSGRKVTEETKYYIDGEEIKSSKYIDFISYKIASTAKLKSQQEIIGQMSIEDNLLIPSSGKLDILQYSLENGKIKKSLYQEFADKFLSGEKMVKELSPNEVMAMALERWYIFRPRVLILFDVYVGYDLYGISIIQSYIQKFSELGISVILVESSLEYVENISDRIFDGVE